MALSRKYYIKIASIIKDSTTLDAYGDEIIHKDDLINDLSNMFKYDNNLFDCQRFEEACSYKE